jgi:serine/threonine protein kinase
VLLDADGHIRLIDFGLSTLVVDGLRTFCGTPEYIAPEVLTKKRWSAKPLDWWAFGVLLYRMLAGRTPFEGKTTSDVFLSILTEDVVFPSGFPEDARDLVERLLDPRAAPESRPRGKEVMNHRFFAGVDWAALMEKRWKPPPFAPASSDGAGEWTGSEAQQRVLLLPATPESAARG